MARILLGKARITALEQQAFVPPMGLMYLAAVLREHGHEPRIYDAGTGWRDVARFAAAVEAFRPDVVGLSALTLEVYYRYLPLYRLDVAPSAAGAPDAGEAPAFGKDK